MTKHVSGTASCHTIRQLVCRLAKDYVAGSLRARPTILAVKHINECFFDEKLTESLN